MTSLRRTSHPQGPGVRHRHPGPHPDQTGGEDRDARRGTPPRPRGPARPARRRPAWPGRPPRCPPRPAGRGRRSGRAGPPGSRPRCSARRRPGAGPCGPRRAPHVCMRPVHLRGETGVARLLVDGQGVDVRPQQHRGAGPPTVERPHRTGLRSGHADRSRPSEPSHLRDPAPWCGSRRTRARGAGGGRGAGRSCGRPRRRPGCGARRRWGGTCPDPTGSAAGRSPVGRRSEPPAGTPGGTVPYHGAHRRAGGHSRGHAERRGDRGHLIGFPHDDMKAVYAFITRQTKDTQSRRSSSSPPSTCSRTCRRRNSGEGRPDRGHRRRDGPVGRGEGPDRRGRPGRDR